MTSIIGERPLFKLANACGVFLYASSFAVVSCTMPFTERANDPPGLSAGVALQGATSWIWGMMYDENVSTRIWTLGPTGFVREKFGDRFSLSLRASCIPGYMTGWFNGSVFVPDLLMGGKYAFDKSNAIKLSLGAGLVPKFGPKQLELGYLHDFGELFTGSIRIGAPCIVGIGLDYHPPLSRSLMLHVAGDAHPVSQGVAVGLEWHQAE